MQFVLRERAQSIVHPTDDANIGNETDTLLSQGSIFSSTFRPAHNSVFVPFLHFDTVNKFSEHTPLCTSHQFCSLRAVIASNYSD